MAQITGSTTTDWSTVSLDAPDIEQNLANFSARFDQVLTAIDNQSFIFLTVPTPESISLKLFSGQTVNFSGFGFDTDDPVIKSFNYKDPANGDIVGLNGTLKLHFDGNVANVTSFTAKTLKIGSTGFSQTIIGNLVFDPVTNDASGTITEVRQTLGSSQAIAKGSMVLSGDAITGTVTDLSVVSGTNTIKMSGLSGVLFESLDSVTTADQLFAVVGNQMAGNDIILYTNKSAGGMSFFGGDGDDTITIKGPNGDTLTGGAGNDKLDGGPGNDSLIGNSGDDLYVVDSAGDVVTEAVGEGTDTVQVKIITAGQTYILPDNVENGTLLNTVAFNLTGNTESNVLTGNGANNTLLGLGNNDTLNGRAGNDTLDGGAGDDTMAGGTGRDSYIVDSLGDVVTEGVGAGIDTVNSSVTFTLGANLEHLTLTGSADIDGTGNALANTITGNSGVNTLTGGLGNDTYVVQNDTDFIVENVNAGIDLVNSSANFTLAANVENLKLTGGSDVNGTGNELKNVMTGNDGNNTLSGLAGNDKLVGAAGNDTLDGGTGTDTMVGGLGDDTFVVDVATDVVIEAFNGGTDTVKASVNYTLGANLENLELTGNDNLNGTGNGLVNTLTGNSGNNILTGRGGNDTLIGGVGDDTLRGGLGNDTYQINAGDGGDNILENDSTPGNADTLVYGNTIEPLDLVFSRQANDLRIAVHGTTDSVTIQNWYTNPTAGQIESIQAGGEVLLNTQVDALIQAMASFTQNTGLTWEQGIEQQPAQVQTILAASWH